MCGIAGYSLSDASRVDRTLAAQALLAGIAERGADAVGYATFANFNRQFKQLTTLTPRAYRANFRSSSEK